LHPLRCNQVGGALSETAKQKIVGGYREKTIARKTTASKPAPVNLAGFPAGYKEGYNDACASVKDYKRYKADQQYKQGWQDGSFTCKKK
jgi:hypothetical protein